MKIAAISDIHGNIDSLISVFKDIDEEKVDLIVCTGDLVGYGPHPNEVIALIKSREIPCTKGNYDQSVVDGKFSFIRDTKVNSFILPWTSKEVTSSNKYFLDNLPTSLEYDINGVSIKFTHGSPSSINEYLFENEENTLSAMNNLKENILVCGHTHIPSCKKFNDKLFINPGSVGKPKTGRPTSTYCLIEINDGKNINVTHKEVEYDFEKIVKDTQMLKFPEELVLSYKTGKE